MMHAIEPAPSPCSNAGLLPLVPGRIWHAQQRLRFGPLPIRTRMTVVRLDDGRLWVHSPIAPQHSLVAALRELGEVAWVVAPNRSHHLWFVDFLDAFPGAAGFVVPGLPDKRPALARFTPLDTEHRQRWAPELRAIPIDGLPILDEIAWLHTPSSTLILTDLLACFGDDNPAPLRLLARLLGVYRRPRMSLTMKLLVKDPAALARSFELMLGHDIQAIVLAHDRIVDVGAAAELRAAGSWLQRRRDV